SADGIKLREAYIGPEGVLTGSARLAQEAKDMAAQLVRAQEMERRSRDIERKRRELKAPIDVLQAQLESDETQTSPLNREGAARRDQLEADRVAMGKSRHTVEGKTSDKSKKPAR